MVQRDVPRFANGARGTRGENSCFRVKNRKIILETTKAIKPQKEIYADYGSDYWPRSYYKKKQVKFLSKKKINFCLFFSKMNG